MANNVIRSKKSAKTRLGDILSQRQNVPLHYAPPRRHNVPTYAPSPATFCPTFSIWIPTPRAKLARISGISGIYLGQFLAISLAYIWENHCSTCIFRATNCPIWQNVPLSPRRQNVPTYALMHRKVMESCWDILSVVPLCQFEGCAFSEHVLDIFWLHSVSLVFPLHSCS